MKRIRRTGEAWLCGARRRQLGICAQLRSREVYMHARPRVSPRAAFEGESPIPLSTRSVAVDNTIFPNSTQHNINKPSRFRARRSEKSRARDAFRPFAFTSAAHPPTRVDTQSETQSAPAHVDIRRRTVNLQHSSLSHVSTRSPHPPHPPLAERPCGVVSDTVLVVNGCQRAVATAVGEEHAQQRLRECELLMRRHLRGRS